MAYKMTLDLGSKKYDVLASSFAFSRSCDEKGRPQSGVYGGTINVSLEAFEDTTLIEMMLNKQHTAQKGSITYDKGTNDGVEKTLEFEDAFIISYAEAASTHSSSGMSVDITITARKVKVGPAIHENLWPAAKA